MWLIANFLYPSLARFPRSAWIKLGKSTNDKRFDCSLGFIRLTQLSLNFALQKVWSEFCALLSSSSSTRANAADNASKRLLLFWQMQNRWRDIIPCPSSLINTTHFLSCSEPRTMSRQELLRYESPLLSFDRSRQNSLPPIALCGFFFPSFFATFRLRSLSLVEERETLKAI